MAVMAEEEVEKEEEEEGLTLSPISPQPNTQSLLLSLLAVRRGCGGCRSGRSSSGGGGAGCSSNSSLTAQAPLRGSGNWLVVAASAMAVRVAAVVERRADARRVPTLAQPPLATGTVSVTIHRPSLAPPRDSAPLFPSQSQSTSS